MDTNMQRTLWVPSFLISKPQSKLEQMALAGFYGNLKEQLRPAIPLTASTAVIWLPFLSLPHRMAKMNQKWIDYCDRSSKNDRFCLHIQYNQLCLCQDAATH